MFVTIYITYIILFSVKIETQSLLFNTSRVWLSFCLCRTRSGFSTVHVDRKNGTSDAFGRRVRGRDTHRRRGVRISGSTWSRRFLPERRFPTATRMHTSGAVEEQPHHQDQWVYSIVYPPDCVFSVRVGGIWMFENSYIRIFAHLLFSFTNFYYFFFFIGNIIYEIGSKILTTQV